MTRQDQQPLQVTLHADTSLLERKLDELSAKVDSLVALLQGQAPASSYTPAQAAERLQLDRKRVYELLAQGQLQGIRVGQRGWRIPAQALDAFLAGIPQQIAPAQRVVPLRR